MVGIKSGRGISQVPGLLTRGAFGHLTDAQILERFCLHDGDADLAFETLVLRHGPSVLRVCRRVLGDRASAEDAFQATFLVLSRRAASLHLQGSAGPWLQGVAHRIAMKARTAATRRRFHERRSAVPMSFDSDATHLDINEQLRNAVEGLPEYLRAPIVLCYFERMSYKSAAVALGLPAATIRSRLVRARKLLRQRLSAEFKAGCSSGRRDESCSTGYTIPLVLLNATTRAAIAFSNSDAARTAITPSVLKMVEGALTMLTAIRFMRIMAGSLAAIAGVAFAGLHLQAQDEPSRAPREVAKTIAPDPIREPSQDLLIVAESIQTRAKDNQVLVDGPGMMSLWVERDFFSGKLEDSPQPSRPEPMLLKISWTDRMQLLARTEGARGKPTCVARFLGKVTAQCGDGSITCEESMIVRTTDAVPLERIQLAMRAPASETLARLPRTKIAGIEASRNVVVIGAMIDPESKAMANHQRLIAEQKMSYDRRTGEYQVSGKGQLTSFDRRTGEYQVSGKGQLSCSTPVKGPRTSSTVGESAQFAISFHTGMTSGWTLEQGETIPHRVVLFLGDVSVAQSDPRDDGRESKPNDKKKAGILNAQSLRLKLR